jgi:hypothetical protein
VTPEFWIENFQGYSITDCVVEDRHTVYLLAKENPPPGPSVQDFEMLSRTIALYLEEVRGDRGRFSVCDLKMFWHPFIGVTQDPKSQLLTADQEGAVYADGSDEYGLETSVPKSLCMGGLRKSRWIDGRFFIVAGNRKVIYRDAPNSWVSLEAGWRGPVITDDIESILAANTFEDLDGFSRDDLYAVGGKGDVWNWNNGVWRQCAFPSNMMLRSVCCAGDGQVYIGAQSGNVFKGRGDTWMQIHEDSMSLPFKDMVWYEGAVWCTSDYGIWQIKNNKLAVAQLPGNTWRYAGNLSAADGALMLAGIHGAALLKDGKWEVIVDNVEMEKLVAAG